MNNLTSLPDTGSQIAMPLYSLNPILDSRWDDLVASHPKASAFHHRGWLQALAATYGYRPIVLTSTPPGVALADGIAFCEVKSWITGSRLVSLPFSDHCEPLMNEGGGPLDLTKWMRIERRQNKWEFVELRPLLWKMSPECCLVESQSFWCHTLNLAPTLEKIFSSLHKDCIQRRIRRAEREHLSYERGRSEELLNEFYRLLVITRRRHHLLPQPRAWFRNILAFMNPDVEIRLARRDGVAVAGMLTLRHGHTVIYKYGCSDAALHHLAGMPFLMWKLIEESKMAGADLIDFGRTDLDNQGLMEFKNRLGTTCKRITYLRYPGNARKGSVVESYLPTARRLFSVMPDAITSIAGRVAYRHIG